MSASGPADAAANPSRAELKRAYREKPPPAGVFAIRNLESGKVLVASGLNVQGAINSTRFQLEARAVRLSPELHEDWNRLGPGRFTFEVLDVLAPPEDPTASQRDDLQVLEALWVERLSPFGDKGYNTPAPPRP